MSVLEKWIFQEKYYKIPENGKPTHLKLNGGKFIIPNNKINKFYKLYAKDIDNDIKHYICEIKSETYKLFMDVDLLDNEELTDDRILKYSRLIHEVVVHYYGHINPYVIVCTTTPKPVSHNDYNYIKTGIHLIWPDIITSSEHVFWLRDAIIQYLRMNEPDRELYDPWEKVIDEHVYKQNGLRMIYSNKMAFCKICKKTDTCSLCNKTGKYHEGRPYIPYRIINNNNEITIPKYNKLEAIKITSITTDKNVTEFLHKHPSWLDKTDIQKFKHQKRKLGEEDNEGSMKLNFRKKLSTDTEVVKLLQQFVNRNIPNYNDVKLIDMHGCGNNDYYVIRTDSSYCMNLEREHKSNTIYFYVDKHSIYQKCFCNCETIINRKYGVCKDYRSSPYKLPLNILKLLYPYENDNFSIICKLNTFQYLKKDKTGYINNVKNFLNYLETNILEKKINEIN